MRAQFVERDGERYVEVCGQHRARQTFEYEGRETLVANSNAACRLEEVAQNARAILTRRQQMLDDQREVFGKAVFAFDEPRMIMEPSRPFAEADLLGRDRTAQDPFCIDAPCHATNAFSGKGNS